MSSGFGLFFRQTLQPVLSIFWHFSDQMIQFLSNIFFLAAQHKLDSKMDYSDPNYQSDTGVYAGLTGKVIQ